MNEFMKWEDSNAESPVETILRAREALKKAHGAPARPSALFVATPLLERLKRDPACVITKGTKPKQWFITEKGQRWEICEV